MRAFVLVVVGAALLSRPDSAPPADDQVAEAVNLPPVRVTASDIPKQELIVSSVRVSPTRPDDTD